MLCSNEVTRVSLREFGHHETGEGSECSSRCSHPRFKIVTVHQGSVQFDQPRQASSGSRCPIVGPWLPEVAFDSRTALRSCASHRPGSSVSLSTQPSLQSEVGFTSGSPRSAKTLTPASSVLHSLRRSSPSET
mmetsp:Transcript_2060/g.4682  ORF Transcript_2060/g.4682 Transcript_2060/m.4682 type:complete len:133 (+) Transcript_2060:3617-4015(+)